MGIQMAPWQIPKQRVVVVVREEQDRLQHLVRPVQVELVCNLSFQAQEFISAAAVVVERELHQEVQVALAAVVGQAAKLLRVLQAHLTLVAAVVGQEKVILVELVHQE